MSEQISKPSGGGEKGISTLGWVLIIVAGLILAPVLIGFVFGVAGLLLTAVFKAIGIVIGAIGAAFGIIFGLLGGFIALLASFGVVLLLLLPGIIIGVLLARAIGGRKAD